MSGVLVWGYLHLMLFAIWVGVDAARLVLIVRIKNPNRNFAARARLLNLSRNLHLLPRVCFALILPFGIELIAAVNVYPVNPGLRAAAWIIALAWLVVIGVMARGERQPTFRILRYLDIFFEVLAGMAFVVYGLNSLATGAPIDDPWFAAKLSLFGLVFWAAVAVDLSFRPFVAPFAEIGEEGATPEREEAVGQALNNTLVAMGVLYSLLAATAVVGRIMSL